ncbi:MAG: sugar transferase [Chitinophagaceae bacterium]
MTTNTSFALSYAQEFTNRKVLLRTYIDEKNNYFFWKRAFDFTIALMVTCFILSWLLPIIALLIKWLTPGPVFFLQKRVGRGGRTFVCYKFRTMVVNGEANQQQAVENDLRITRLGRFLRKTNIDEFPQFINVLTGSMSIVGPRPHMHADCLRFSEVVQGYKFRNLVKPGLTGLAQVKGFHGPVVNTECITRRYHWDAFYVKNAGFGLDLEIISKTAVQRIGFLFKELFGGKSLSNK